MNCFHSLGGMIEVELTSADVGGALSAVNDSGIHIYSVESISDLTLHMKLRRRDYPLFTKIVCSRGCEVSQIERVGLYWAMKGFLHRPILVFGLLAIILLVFYLPGRIFFIQVDGNSNLPDRLILAEAENCGICFGASREAIRSEKVKNALLARIPELQWAGVNTKGCVAVISVREKTATKDIAAQNGVSSIIADRDGVIISYTAQQGNALCRIGQAVRAGQVLISGYTDCGLSIRACRSVGEVYAQTNRQLTVISPRKYASQKQICGIEKKTALIIGKKRINFYKDSGILGTTYDKMSVEKKLTLPGGFVLPICVITEFWTLYEDSTVSYPPEAAKELLDAFSKNYLTQNMVAGRILQSKQDFSDSEEVFRVSGNYACLEMIGREQQEETLGDYGKSD